MKYLTCLIAFAICACSIPTVSPAEPCATFKRGDANDDGSVNITDVIFISNWLSLGGAAPCNTDAADANDSGSVNITDITYLTNWMNLGGPAPPAPGPYVAGIDIGPDPLANWASEPVDANDRVNLNADGDIDARDLVDPWVENPDSSTEHFSQSPFATEGTKIVGVWENPGDRTWQQACNDGDKSEEYVAIAESNGVGDVGFTMGRLVNGSQKVKLDWSILFDTLVEKGGCSQGCYEIRRLHIKLDFPTITPFVFTCVSDEAEEIDVVVWVSIADVVHTWWYYRSQQTCIWELVNDGIDPIENTLDITNQLLSTLNDDDYEKNWEVRKVTIGQDNGVAGVNGPKVILLQPVQLDEASTTEKATVEHYLELYYEWAE